MLETDSQQHHQAKKEGESWEMGSPSTQGKKICHILPLASLLFCVNEFSVQCDSISLLLILI